MNPFNELYWRRIIAIFGLGFLGVLSSLPVTPKLIEITGQEPPIPIPVIQAASVLQSSILLLGMVFLGAWLTPKLNLGTPILDFFLRGRKNDLKLKKIILPSAFGGALGGTLIILFYNFSSPALPPEFVENGNKFTLPLITKLLYGGVTEEILVRWGMMSLFTWICYRTIQRSDSSIKTYNFVLGIFASAILFGALHIGAANILSPVLTIQLIFYIIIANSIFGILAGFLFWKNGLESAIIAHMMCHLTMVFLTSNIIKI